MSNKVFLNGKVVPVVEAMISVTDRGFMFGDGVYEVMPFYSHIGFRLQEHIARLMRSLAAVRIPSPYSEDEWMKHIQWFNKQHADSDQSIYLQVTRGPASTRHHAFPQVVCPTVYMMSSPLLIPPADMVQRGVTAVTTNDFRWLHCDIKSVSLLGSVLLSQHAIDCGVAETVLIRDGCLTEGASSNIFIVKNGVLYTPPSDHLVLAGITYDVILELAQAHHMPVEVGPVSQEALFSADEVWLTSSTKEVLAITHLDNTPIGKGVPGPIFTYMHQLYQNFKQEVMRQGGYDG